MAILINCRCGRQLRAKDSAAGTRSKCPACGDPVDVPKPTEGRPDEMVREPWFYWVLEAYAKVTLCLGGGIFATGAMIWIVLFILSAMIDHDEYRAIAAAALALPFILGISLLGLFTLLLPSLLILLAVQAARDLRHIRGHRAMP